MWDNFFAAGGWGMYPTLLFGFLLIAGTVLNAIRREARFERVVLALGALTIASGMLGTVTGVCKTVLYIASDAVKPEDKFPIFAMGLEESLHNMVLALILFVVAGIVYAITAFRRKATA